MMKRSVKIISAVLLVAVLATAAAVFAVTRENDERTFTAEFSRRNKVYTPRETTAKAVTTRRPAATSAPETTEAVTTAETTKALPGLKNGAFRAVLTMKKTAWGAGEVPEFTLDFGLTDASYGAGDLVLHINCDGMRLSDELKIENYLYAVHAFDGKKAPDSETLSLLRRGAEGKENEELPDYEYGMLYLWFEFIPAEDNKVFGNLINYNYDDDDEDGELTYEKTGVWIGGFWCAYAVTPAGTRFARHDASPEDFFADTVIKQYRAGSINDAELCRAYWQLALSGATYLSATSPISDGKTTLGYYSPTLRAAAREPVSDADILSLVAKCGPFGDRRDDDAVILKSRGRELAEAILGVLRDQGVITADEYAAETERLLDAPSFVNTMPEFDRRFSKYRKLIEGNIFTNE